MNVAEDTCVTGDSTNREKIAVSRKHEKTVVSGQVKTEGVGGKSSFHAYYARRSVSK